MQFANVHAQIRVLLQPHRRSVLAHGHTEHSVEYVFASLLEGESELVHRQVDVFFRAAGSRFHFDHFAKTQQLLVVKKLAYVHDGRASSCNHNVEGQTALLLLVDPYHAALVTASLLLHISQVLEHNPLARTTDFTSRVLSIDRQFNCRLALAAVVGLVDVLHELLQPTQLHLLPRQVPLVRNAMIHPTTPVADLRSPHLPPDALITE
mmetsp:Transcript_29127/g.72605  ORF Transcript_29127/g.72605 Transcript_29127/m.72605 type:complete len:208 (-) Transcript_29127:835-1458(-)